MAEIPRRMCTAVVACVTTPRHWPASLPQLADPPPPLKVGSGPAGLRWGHFGIFRRFDRHREPLRREYRICACPPSPLVQPGCPRHVLRPCALGLLQMGGAIYFECHDPATLNPNDVASVDEAGHSAFVERFIISGCTFGTGDAAGAANTAFDVKFAALNSSLSLTQPQYPDRPSSCSNEGSSADRAV